MRATVARAVLVAIALAGCTPAIPYADCGDAPAEECGLVVNTALDLIEDQLEHLVVLGARPWFVVVACLPVGTTVIDAHIDEDSAVDATVREHSPDISHVCLAGVPPT
jgi:hypothetical protein